MIGFAMSCFISMAFSTKEMLSLNDWQWQPLILQKSDALGEDDFSWSRWITLQGINISHLGKRKIIFKMPFFGDMLVPWRVMHLNDWYRLTSGKWGMFFFPHVKLLWIFWCRVVRGPPNQFPYDSGWFTRIHPVYMQLGILRIVSHFWLSHSVILGCVLFFFNADTGFVSQLWRIGKWSRVMVTAPLCLMLGHKKGG